MHRTVTVPGENGFGMIEVIVSMFLISIVAMAFLPVLIQTSTVAASNSTLATATQIVAQQLEQVGASGSSCSAVKAFAATTPSAVSTARGTLQPHLFLDVPAADVCSDPYLRVVSLRVWVTGESSTAALAEAKMLILLDAP